MEILSQSQIAQEINKCNPHNIAVAYIGTDWDYFIKNFKNLENVIISPTIGSNPRAILSLAQSIGWKKVHFLKELHAKIFIGKKTSIIGSANLTKNGLSGVNLIETCVKLITEEAIHELFNSLLEKARMQYPNEADKLKELMYLEQTWGSACANGIIKEKHSRSSASNILDFSPLSNQQFYVSWYQKVKVTHSSDIDESVIHDEVHFLPKDKVEPYKWVLMWEITDKDKPSKNSTSPYWLYIHEIYNNGVVSVVGEKDYQYSKCAIQRNDKKTFYSLAPFKLTKGVKDAFKKAVIDKEISKYLIQASGDYVLKKSFTGMPLLINKMKQILKKNS